MPYGTGVARLLEEIRKGSDACCPFWPLPLLAGPREEAFHAALRLSSTSMQALRKKLPMPPSAARSQQSAAQPSAEDSELMSGAEFVNMDEIYKVGSWQRRVQGGGGGGREREGAERGVQEEVKICWWERSVFPSSRPPLPSPFPASPVSPPPPTRLTSPILHAVPPLCHQAGGDRKGRGEKNLNPPLPPLPPSVLSPAQSRLSAIKREEEAARGEEERLNAEKQRHVRLLKRVRDEECSRFGSSLAGGPLAKRYQLLGLLGKGGFSEVFKVLVHGGGDEENRVTLWERNYYCPPPCSMTSGIRPA